jgi:small-conductance mechanosensitive channel
MQTAEFLSQVYLGNSLQNWLLSLSAFLVTFTVLPLLRSLVMSQRKRIQSFEPPMGVELALVLIARTSKLFLWIVALYVGLRFLEMGPRVEKSANVVIVVVFWLQVALWGTAAVNFALDRQRQRGAAAGDPAVQGSLGILSFIARLAIFAVAALLALDNLGVNITALVAGLGVGGIAIALAVQTLLGDLLASLSITLDKPFIVGDWLRVDSVEGTVERIGVKSTRLRSLSGEQIVIANADLLKSRVHNLGRMPERRVLFTLGVVYETPRQKLELIPGLIETVVTATPHTRFQYCVFRNFGDSALQFEVVYFVALEAGAKYLEILNSVNYAIHAAFEREGIAFAYPTQTVVVRREPAGREPGDRESAS